MKEDNDKESEELEKEHFFKILLAFRSYRSYAQSVTMKRLTHLDTLPAIQQEALDGYKATLQQVLTCIETNHRVLLLITEVEGMLFENLHMTQAASGPEALKVESSDIDKVQVTLKQIYREWSSDGVVERIQAYQPILDEIEQYFPTDSGRSRENVNILVPGAGLGRLAFEIAKLGFSCQGNEFSLFMLFASNFILNRCPGVDMFTIYPWTQGCDNNLSSKEMIRPVRFPDTDPSVLHSLSAGKLKFSMVAGDFLEVYTAPGEYDCVATCFFIDCAVNIFTFIERIYLILKPGGVWISLGPLQYHYSSSAEENSIEPSFEDVKRIIEAVGFRIEKEKTRVPTLYCQNRTSMLKQHYESVFLACVKP